MRRNVQTFALAASFALIGAVSASAQSLLYAVTGAGDMGDSGFSDLAVAYALPAVPALPIGILAVLATVLLFGGVAVPRRRQAI